MLYFNEKLVVTDGISPVFDGAYGTLTIESPCSISGTYDIVGDVNGCGCVKFNNRQDISGLRLRLADGATLDEAKGRGSYYKILDAPNGVSGEFDMSELSSSWTVKYAADGKSAYLRRRIGMRVVVR